VKSVLNITTKQKYNKEQSDFPESFTKIEEGEHYLDKAKPLKWMDAEIKTKEFDISKDYRPKRV
jgi:hypothetical protein